MNTTATDSLLTFTEITPQTTILDTPATNTFPTFPDFTELIETPIATVTTNTVPIYDMALHTTVLNETKTNTSTAYMDLTQLANSPDTTTSKSVPIYDMTQKSTTLDTTCMTANTFSTFTDITLQTNALEAPTQNTLTANMTQQTMRLDATTDPNFLQTSNHLPQQTVTYTGCTTTNTTELHVPQDWTDTTLTHLSLDIISKKIDGLEEKIDKILSILEMPKVNIKQKKTEHHIQILPAQDENDEYTIPPEVKQKIVNSSTGKGNFAKNLVFTIFSYEERKGRNCTGKSSSGADVQPLNPGKLEAVKKCVFQLYGIPPSSQDKVWREECVKAIDSSLRKERWLETKQANRRYVQ